MIFHRVPRWIGFSFIVAVSICALGFTPSMEDQIQVVASRGGETLVRVEAGEWEGEKASCATATVFRFISSRGCYEKTASFSLKSEWPPARVLLTDKAEFIIVLNNVETRAEGNNAIVVYRSDGSIARTWDLKDIVEVAGTIRITFEGGIRWADWAVVRWFEERGVVQIGLLPNENTTAPKVSFLRLDLPSLELAAPIVTSINVSPSEALSSASP